LESKFVNEPLSAIRPEPSFDIGKIFNRTFGTIRNNFVAFCLASFLIVGLPQLIIGLLPIFIDVFDANRTNFDAMMAVFVILGVISMIVIVVLQFILQGAIVHASISDFNGQRVSFKDSVAAARKHIWPLIGFAILATLGIMGGLLLLLIPGIILMLMWAVGIPALVMEDTGVSNAFARSSFLTSGYKWWILLLMLIFAVISGIIGAVGAVFTAPLGGGLQDVIMGGGTPTSFYFLVSAVINALVQMFSSMVSAAGTAALYYELRIIKEGIGPKALADVFD
jgi:hypothetical protein